VPLPVSSKPLRWERSQPLGSWGLYANRLKAWRSCRKCEHAARYQGERAVVPVFVRRQALWIFATGPDTAAAEILRSPIRPSSLRRPLKPLCCADHDWRNVGTPVAPDGGGVPTANRRMLEDIMSVARSLIVLVLVMGGWSVTACAPPTPKVAPSVAPPMIEREPVAPVRQQDRSFQPMV